MNSYSYLMRLDRPLPILIMLWPTLWSLVAAGLDFPSPSIIFIFITGGFLMRTLGCVFNDIADHKFDAYVKRTKKRMIATNFISVQSAVIVGSTLLLFAFFFVLLLNRFTIFLSVISLLLTLVYPFFKRFFIIPQLILGCAFNFGIIMAYSSRINNISCEMFLIYIACIFWTLAYDTMYSLADKPDDIRLGLKSSAITFGHCAGKVIVASQFLMLSLLAGFGYLCGYGGGFYLSLMICCFMFYSQRCHWQKQTIITCIKAFSDNHWIGLVIFVGILLQNYKIF